MSLEIENEEETILNLPSIEERLGALRPSRQLLEFYRRKTEELETEHDKLFNKIEGKDSAFNPHISDIDVIFGALTLSLSILILNSQRGR